MKRIYLLLAVIITAFALSIKIQAQTDITDTKLNNAGFNTACNYLTSTAATNLASGTTNNQTINGWTLTASAGNSASSTFEYGYKGTLNSPGSIPLYGYDFKTGTNQGSLGISVAWTATITYFQEITLPAGTYILEYAAYNSGPNAADNSRVGWVPNSGSSVISTKTSFTQFTWTTERLTFTLASETIGKIQVGLNAPNVGSGSVGRIFFDYVKIISMDGGKTTLQNLLTSATEMYNNQQPIGVSNVVYDELNTAINNAQIVFNNPTATSQEILDQQDLLNAAINKVKRGIYIKLLQNSWSPLPFNSSDLILNPSFEIGVTANNQSSFIGWTNTGPFVSQNNTSFAKKAGTYYIEKWKSSGNWTGLKISQKIVDIPNGIYRLTAGALNDPNTTGGAFVFANNEKVEVFTVNDYTLLVTVTNNELTFGYEVVNGGNYVATDNFRLSYISDGSPFLVVAPESLSFDMFTLQKTFTVNGGNLTANAILTAPAGVTLNKTSLTPAEVAAGITVTATYDGSTAMTNAQIVISTTGATNSIVTVNAQPDNATSAIVNPNFSNGTTGWTSTTSAQNKGLASNQNTGAFEGTMPFYENWNGSAYTGKIYQVVNNLPAGRYLLKMGVFANNGGEGLFVYGDSYETAVSNASVPAFFEVEFVTPGGSAEIGLNIKSGTNNWVGIDNVSLKYLGTVSEPAVSVSASNLFFTEAALTKTFTLTGLNLTADISLVSNVAGVSLNPGTVSKDDAELVTGKTITATFDPAAVGAGSLTGTITVSTAGVADKTIAIATSKDSGCFTPLYNNKTNLVLDPFCNDRSKFGGWGSVEVSNTTVLCGLRSIKVSGGSLDVSVAGGAAIQSNKTYRVKANIFVPAGHTAKFGTFLIGNSGDVDVYTSTTNDEWEVVDFTFKTATVTTGGVFFQRVSGSGGVYIDNYEMYELPTLNAPVNDEDNGRILFTSVGQTLEVPVTATGFTNGFTVTSDNDKFEVQTPTLPATGGNVTVRFIGTMIGQYNGTLTIQSQNPASPIPGIKKVAGAGTKLEIPMVADITTGNSNNANNDSKVFISGNNVIAQFTLNAATQVEMNVFNVNGMLIASEKQMLNAGANQLVLNTNISNGVYFVKLNIDGEVSTTKLVK